MSDMIVNKVAESGIVTLDLEQFYPKAARMVFDLKEHLFMGLILKEKDFRAALQQLDWSIYNGANVAVTCSADAIIPVWAYMLVASYLEPVAANVVFGTEQEMIDALIQRSINTLNVAEYTDKRVVVKGCGEINIPASAYLSITHRLRPVVKSIMYGEPCSTVPIYKKKN